MSQPLDPHDVDAWNEGESEYSWGSGLFPPGISAGDGQISNQDDFGDNMKPRTNKIGDKRDNYARAVADRRTDSTDPESNRDFTALGNEDRYGKQPPLIRTKPQRNSNQLQDKEIPSKAPRSW